jgi:hypothetical protein
MDDNRHLSGLTLMLPIPGAPSNMQVHDAAEHDEKWFKARPGRTHRLRPLLPDERAQQGDGSPHLVTIVKRLGEYKYIAVAFPFPEAFKKGTPAGFCKRIKEDEARELFEIVAPPVSGETLQQIENQTNVARARDHNDAEWFASNPRRNHRLRLPSPQERAARPLPDDIMVVVRQMRPGIRIRISARITSALHDTEQTLKELFDLAAKRDPQLAEFVEKGAVLAQHVD